MPHSRGQPADGSGGFGGPTNGGAFGGGANRTIPSPTLALRRVRVLLAEVSQVWLISEFILISIRAVT